MAKMIVLALLCSILGMIASQTRSQQYFIIAPNIIRVDVDESILINLAGIPNGEAIPVTLYFQMTGSNERLSEKTVNVRDSTHETTIKISREQLPQQETKGNKFITLVARSSSPDFQFEDSQPILLSFKSGFVFIQTDKPLYTPSQRVDIRIVVLNQQMYPDSNQVQVDIASPDSIVVHRVNKTAVGGFTTMQFDFPPVPVFGNWSVRVYYGHLFKASTSVQFEVKEYVLPKFNVIVQTDQEFILPETTELNTHITAKYVFGEPVKGNFHIKFGVFMHDGSLMVLQQKQGTLAVKGKGFPDLTLRDVTIDLEMLMGKRLIIQAFVTDSATGETINANNTRVAFTRTPYRFNWDDTARFFKKGLPFEVKAKVQYINGLPADHVPVAVSATALLSDGTQHILEGAIGRFGREDVSRISGPDGQVSFRLDVPSTATMVTFNLQTTDKLLNIANVEFTVEPEESTSGEFLLVVLPSGQVTQQIGRMSSIEVQLTHHVNAGTLHYFVITGGEIVFRNQKQIQNANTGIEFRITHKMAPSARIVAYYINSDGHVISDALLIQVERTCENRIGIRFEGLEKETDGTFKSDGKEKNATLRVSANEYTKIGLLAVDEAVFALRKYHRLTQKKVFERMAGYDLGCGPGGGQTSAAIFKDAGVTVLTNAILDVAQREELECPKAKGRTRRFTAEDHNEILNKYQGEKRIYCEMGLQDAKDPDSFLCRRQARRLSRKRNLALDSPQIEAFYECCKARFDRGRSGEFDELYINVDVDNAVVRSNFPESWMFFDVETGESDHVERQVTLPDSVTTWVIEAIGVSDEYLMCVADPVKLKVQPLFFLELRLPYSVQRMEQIEIIVSVFNYAEDELPVTVYLKGVEGLCSPAQPGEYTQGITIHVPRKRSASVKYVIVPLEAKSIPIEVYAVTKSPVEYKDVVRKSLNVLPEGYKQRDTVTITMDPANTRASPERTEAGGQNQSYRHTQLWTDDEEGRRSQRDIIRYTLNDDIIPGTHDVHVSLIGNVMGNVIATVTKGQDDLFSTPSGCGEQAMMHLAPKVYVYRYLRHTDQFTAEMEVAAKQFIGDGITLELSQRRPDGSFAMCGHNLQSSTWLTAFVGKVFCQARDFGFVDESMICTAMEWLIAETQNDDGSFGEIYRVRNQEMLGRVRGGVQGSTSMTAYVLISLQECECATVDKTDSVAAATAFLELQLPTLTRPYEIAITTYALTLANSIKAADAAQMLKDIAIYDGARNSRHWGSDDSEAIEVETTSYALLALLEMGDVQYSHAILNWLTTQENYQGGFMSTQDTVIALQALSEYAIKSEMNTSDIDCHVSCQEAQYDKEFLLKPDNAIVRQHDTIKVPQGQAGFNVLFQSSGTGVGQLKFESSYNIPEPRSEKCAFKLIIGTIEGRSAFDDEFNDVEQDPTAAGGLSRSRVGRLRRSERGRVGGGATEDQSRRTTSSIHRNGRGRAGGLDSEYIFMYDIKVKFLKGKATGMAILDVGLYTGYEPIIQDLDKVLGSKNIQHYGVTERSVVFYLNEIRDDRFEHISFRAQRIFNVGKAQPVAVRVYDYYNPTVECVKFVHPQRGSSLLNTLCEGNTCACAEGKCAQQPYTNPADFDGLKDEACQSAAHFAYEVEVVSIKRRGNFQNYTMTIRTPLKNGLDNVTRGENRTFWKSKNCGIPDLKKRIKYLVIGTGGLPVTTEGLPSYKYIVDEKMSLYEWPTGREETTNTGRRIIEKLQRLEQDLDAGCPL